MSLYIQHPRRVGKTQATAQVMRQAIADGHTVIAYSPNAEWALAVQNAVADADGGDMRSVTVGGVTVFSGGEAKPKLPQTLERF